MSCVTLLGSFVIEFDECRVFCKKESDISNAFRSITNQVQNMEIQEDKENVEFPYLKQTRTRIFFFSKNECIDSILGTQREVIDIFRIIWVLMF